jgi:hypothetical protein
VRDDYGTPEGLDCIEDGGIAGALSQRLEDATDGGAINGPENTEIQT